MRFIWIAPLLVSTPVWAGKAAVRATALVKADTKAESELRVAPQVVVPVSGGSQLQFTPFLTLKSAEGEARIPLLGTAFEAGTWGGTVTFLTGMTAEDEKVGTFLAIADKDKGVIDRAMAYCDAITPNLSDPKNTGYASFKTKRESMRPPPVPGVEDVCAEAKTNFKAKKIQTYPQWQFDLTISNTRQQFTWRTEADDVVSAEVEEPRDAQDLGVGVTHLRSNASPHHTVFELFGNTSGSWKKSTTTGRWCQPVGTLESEDGVPVTSCSEAAIGEPTESQALTLTALGGVIPQASDTWRFSVGGQFRSAQVGGGEASNTLDLLAPLYVRIAKGSPFKTGSSEGLFRVTPRVQLPVADGKFGAYLEFSFLGDRSMFGDPTRWK